jgi:hypothetical protein
MQEICHNLKLGGKISYRSRAAATKKLKASHEGGLHVYRCPHGNHWHLSSQEQRSKKEQPPSAKTLRGLIENAARSIAAQRRYIEKADRVLAAQTAKAEAIKKAAEQDHAETLAYIEREANRLHRV